MRILGISAFYHDAAAALLFDDKIVAAAQEERFTRIKHDAAFPSNAIRFCLDYGGCGLNDIDAIAFYDKPFLKFERLLETYYAFSPRGLPSFIQAMPGWIKEKLFMKKNIYAALGDIGPFNKANIKLLFPEHHLSHAASAFYPSSFEESAILTLDGVGEWATASIYHGRGNRIRVIKELDFPHSPGLLYSSFTYYCGFKVNSGEYKLMGLAPYGNRHSTSYTRYLAIIKSKLVTVCDDGSVFLNQEYFNYATGLHMVPDHKWQQLFGFPKRLPESGIEQQHCDLALAIQTVMEEIVLKMAGEAQRLTGSRRLCMAGGVALNCVANGRLHEAGKFDEIFIQPAAGDAGGALGAAYSARHIYFDMPRTAVLEQDALQGSYLGPGYNEKDIAKSLASFNAVWQIEPDIEHTAATTAELLAAGNVVGWFQGRMEFGPRALGARSILADARNPEMQKKLNLKIKQREGFRPFAPAVLAEDVQDYFELQEPSPYMLFVKPVKKSRLLPEPPDYGSLSMADKLASGRSGLPAITHVDYSARIQTVDKETNVPFWQLLQSFKQLTGCAVLVNTSFNVRGEPIVNTPRDAYRCFMRTGMDYLVLGNFILDKKKQPPWMEANTAPAVLD